MTDREYKPESHVGELLSGYLDGELTQQLRQRVEIHLDACAQCRDSFEELGALRQRMGRARFSVAGQDQWREKMNDTTVNVTRGIGWLLLVGALLIIAGIVVFLFWTDPSIEFGWKLLITAFYAGLGALFVSVLRQRLIERKTDKYKDVEI